MSQAARGGCSRGLASLACPFIEPIGSSREDFYEAKLVLGLPWYCPAPPTVGTDDEGTEYTEWSFQWDAPEDLGGAIIDSEVLQVGKHNVSFEMVCNRLETKFCDYELGLVCACCTEELTGSVCPSCRYATGWHKCSLENNHRHFLWRKGTLFAGALDVQRVLYNLHRKLVPSAHLELKAEEYVDARLIDKAMAERVLRVIEQERGHDTYANDLPDEPAGGAAATFSSRLTPAQMAELLAKREAMMRTGIGDSDKWRVYHHIVGCIERGQLLRLMVQASAGISTKLV